MSSADLPYRLLWSPLKRIGEFAWYSRSRISCLNFPIPCRLPYGGWFLAYGDAMGARICGYHLSRHPYEEGQWKFVSRFLKPKMTFFDVGANQGFYTVLAAKRVGSEGKIFSFEPAVTEFRKLLRNLAINRCKNVATESVALGNHEGFTEFYLCLDHQGSFSSISRPAEDVTAEYERLKVEITTLDSYVQRCQVTSLDLLKIDVEGGELGVLKGGDMVFKTLRPIVICEVEDRRTRQWGYQAREIVEFLHDYDYLWFSVLRDGTLQPAIFTENYEWSNLVGIPKEHEIRQREATCR